MQLWWLLLKTFKKMNWMVMYVLPLINDNILMHSHFKFTVFFLQGKLITIFVLHRFLSNQMLSIIRILLPQYHEWLFLRCSSQILWIKLEICEHWNFYFEAIRYSSQLWDDIGNFIMRTDLHMNVFDQSLMFFYSVSVKEVPTSLL